MADESKWVAGRSATQQDVVDCIEDARGSQIACAMCAGTALKLHVNGSTMSFTMGGNGGPKTAPDGAFRHYLLMTCNDCGHLHWFDASIVGGYIESK